MKPTIHFISVLCLSLGFGCESKTESVVRDAGANRGADAPRVVADTGADARAVTSNGADTRAIADLSADARAVVDTGADAAALAPNDAEQANADGPAGANPGSDASTDKGMDKDTGAGTDTGTVVASGECSLLQEGFSTLKGGTTGGQGGKVVTVNNQSGLEQYAGASEPYIIRVDGKIRISPKGKEVSVKSNKTLIGIGTTGEIDEGGFKVDGNNVIIRNLTIGNTFVEGDWDGKGADWDGIQMDTVDHVWIDHCDFHHIRDGMIDSRKNTTNVTVSWNILRDHNKVFGIGWTDDVTAEISVHHNWIRNTGQRNPSADNLLRAHLYNNFLQNISIYGSWARGKTNMVLENCVFDKVNHPYLLNNPDIPNAGGGTLIAIGNIVRPNCTGKTESSGDTYGVFKPSDHYQYRLDPAEELEALLAKCAGPRPELGLE